MKIEIEVGHEVRSAHVLIGADELRAVHLSIAGAEKRNRTAYYMRRHPVAVSEGMPAAKVGPNQPLRAAQEPPKWSIPRHIEEMCRSGALPQPKPVTTVQAERFALEPTLLAVPVSDLVANLLRPCFHRNGLGTRRLFFLEGEPIDRRSYWCACFFESGTGGGRLQLRPVRFDPATDLAFGDDNLLDEGLVWAAALVPLVKEGQALNVMEIACHDYDLRQLFGRDAEARIQYIYEGWYEQWDARVEAAAHDHAAEGGQFASFYHSALGLDRLGGIHIYQTETTLPALANMLVRDGIVFGGLLDSGGSCALYDVNMASFLNHGWYYREQRGAILVFELLSAQRVPDGSVSSWLDRRRKVESCKQ